MTPQQYRVKFNPNVREWAKKLKVSREYLYWVCQGNPTGKKLAKRFEDNTSGLITRNEAMFPEEYR